MTRTERVDPIPRGCLEVREALAKGDPLSGAAEVHVAGCVICTGLSTEPSETDDDGAALFATVQAELNDERGLVAWLRSLPTQTRVVAAAAVAAGLIALIGVTLPRGRFAPMPIDRVVLVVTVLGALLALTLRLGLRPLQAAPPSAGLSLACVVGGLLLPFLFALVPFSTKVAGIPGVSFARITSGCFFLGATAGTLVVVALRALDRGAHGSRSAVLLAATAGGLTASAALELHCPATAPAHLLLGHATVALVLVLVYGAVSRQSAR